MATADASVSTTKVFEKSGRWRTGMVVICIFNVVNALSASIFHVNLVPRNKSVRGEARVAYPRTNLR